MKARFGTAGNPENFYSAGYKASKDLPRWLNEIGLDAYEYSAGRGVRIKDATAAEIGAQAKKYDVVLSFHAPYFINLAAREERQIENNFNYILSSVLAAEAMGADRVVFHAGGQGKETRADAFAQTKKGFAQVLERLEQRGHNKVVLLPETMGKKGQIGTLEEVVELCAMAKAAAPALDFGHLHAVSGGGFTHKDEYRKAFDYIGEKLGASTLENIHVHFSRIEFTKAGEKRHWTFQDPYGPPYEPFIEALAEYGAKARVISESAGTQDVDALIMSDYYNKITAKA